jgi:hypothetical protein
MEKLIYTSWDATSKILVTTLRGKVNEEDVDSWEASLTNTLASIPDGTRFKILVNLHGFEAENMDVHKRYRTIMPLLLAQYGYRIGYLDMFPEAEIELHHTRGIRCIAMANVHHNADKMNDYQRRFANVHEHYFTEPEDAWNWITNVVIT